MHARISVVVIALGTSLATAQPAKKGGEKGDLAAAAAALNGADSERAAKAATALGAATAPAAHEALLDGLALGLPPAVAVPALGALAAHPAPPDVGALKRYAGHHNPVVRAAAVVALAMYPDPSGRAMIVARLHDPQAVVRSGAAVAAARGRIRDAVEPLLLLLAKGEEPAARALAQLADPVLAARIADQLGKVPEPMLALCLGGILVRNDFGPDPARVEVVRAISKLQDVSAIKALTEYLDATAKLPPRPSRAEAQMIVEARLGGGK